MMPFTKQHSAYAWVVTCILFLINLTFHNLPLHSSYKIHQPITDYFLRLPYSELLEKRLFRSRANRRLVFEYLLLYVIGQYVWFNHAPSFCGRSLLAGLLRTHRWYRTNKQNTAIFLSNMFFVSVQYAALVFHQCLS